MRISLYRWRVTRGRVILSRHFTRAGAMRRMANIKRVVQECLDQIPDVPETAHIRGNIERMSYSVRIERTEKSWKRR